MGKTDGNTGCEGMWKIEGHELEAISKSWKSWYVVVAPTTGWRCGG